MSRKHEGKRKTSKRPPLTFFQRRLAGGGFSSLHLLREKTAPCSFVEIVLIDNFVYLLGEMRLQTTMMNHCLGLTIASGQIGAVFACGLFAYLEAKNRAKRVFWNVNFKTVIG